MTDDARQPPSAPEQSPTRPPQWPGAAGPPPAQPTPSGDMPLPAIEDGRAGVQLQRYAGAAKSAGGSAARAGRDFARKNNILAIVALLVSVAGIPTFILAAVGAILGHVALRQIKQSQQAGAGMAKGAIGIGWAVVGIELLVVCCAAAGAISGAFSVIHFLF